MIFDIIKGIEKRDHALGALESKHGAWVSWARAVAKEVSKIKGQVTADDIRKACVAADYWPGNLNAMGAVFKEKGWEGIGYCKSTYAANKARVQCIWRWQG